MSSTKKNKFFLKTLVTTKIGGCGCGKPKPSDAYQPTQKPKLPLFKITIPNNNHPNSSSTSTTLSTATLSSSSSSQPSHSDSFKSKPTKIDSSIAVVKDSDNPYEDFRQSMIQMIVEKEMFSKEELQELLRCFLELNARHHHDVIIEAFSEIWNCDLVERVRHARCGTCMSKIVGAMHVSEGIGLD